MLGGEVTFKIGEEVTVGGPCACAFMPRGLAHAWKNSGAKRRGCCFFIPRPERAGFSRSRSGCSPPTSRLLRKTSEPPIGTIAGDRPAAAVLTASGPFASATAGGIAFRLLENSLRGP